MITLLIQYKHYRKYVNRILRMLFIPILFFKKLIFFSFVHKTFRLTNIVNTSRFDCQIPLKNKFQKDLFDEITSV